MSKADIVSALPKKPDNDGPLDLEHARRMYGPQIRLLTPKLAKRLLGIPTWGIARSQWSDSWNDGHSRRERASHIQRVTVQSIADNGNVRISFGDGPLLLKFDNGGLGSGKAYYRAFVWLPVHKKDADPARASSPRAQSPVRAKAHSSSRAQSPVRAKVYSSPKAHSSPKALVKSLAQALAQAQSPVRAKPQALVREHVKEIVKHVKRTYDVNCSRRF